MRAAAVVALAMALAGLVVGAAHAQTVTRSRTVPLDDAARDAAARRGASWPPAAYNVSGVPWRQQINDFDCGAASAQMVLQYLAAGDAAAEAAAASLTQSDIMNVARTTWYDGTWSGDILRVGKFSALSTPALDWYTNPNGTAGGGARRHGFPGRPVGAAAASHMSATPWLDQAKGVLALGWPLLLLMNWDATAVRDGHYRVLVGYDDARQTVYFNDPWGRDQAPVQAFSYHNLSLAWNYVEAAHPGQLPYWAAVYTQWAVDLHLAPSDDDDAAATAEMRPYKLTATVAYPSFAAFAPYPAAAATVVSYVSLALADGWYVDTSGANAGTRATVAVGPLAPGEQVTVAWPVVANTTLLAAPSGRGDGDDAQWISVAAYGVVQDSADSIYCCGGGGATRDPTTAVAAGLMASTRTVVGAAPSPLRRRLADPNAPAAPGELDADLVQWQRDGGATAALTAATAGYNFPAYDYADTIGGAANQTVAELLRDA